MLARPQPTKPDNRHEYCSSCISVGNTDFATRQRSDRENPKHRRAIQTKETKNEAVGKVANPRGTEYAGTPQDEQSMERLNRALNYFNLSNNNLRYRVPAAWQERSRRVRQSHWRAAIVGRRCLLDLSSTATSTRIAWKASNQSRAWKSCELPGTNPRMFSTSAPQHLFGGERCRKKKLNPSFPTRRQRRIIRVILQTWPRRWWAI